MRLDGMLMRLQRSLTIYPSEHILENTPSGQLEKKKWRKRQGLPISLPLEVMQNRWKGMMERAFHWQNISKASFPKQTPMTMF